MNRSKMAFDKFKSGFKTSIDCLMGMRGIVSWDFLGFACGIAIFVAIASFLVFALIVLIVMAL
jgi:hypothetical protein